jgi:hypothetical protein
MLHKKLLQYLPGRRRGFRCSVNIEVLRVLKFGFTLPDIDTANGLLTHFCARYRDLQPQPSEQRLTISLQSIPIDPMFHRLLHTVHKVPHGRALTAGFDQLPLPLRGVHNMHEVLQGFVGAHTELLLTEGDAR